MYAGILSYFTDLLDLTNMVLTFLLDNKPWAHDSEFRKMVAGIYNTDTSVEIYSYTFINIRHYISVFTTVMT